jgi:hypothetical protein
MTITTSAFEAVPIWKFNAAPSLLQAALAYAEVGVAVFPVEPRGKRPLTPHGLYNATIDPGRIHAWWERWPQANIGLPCRLWWVLDIDPAHGGLHSFQQLLLHEAAFSSMHTRRQLTGGGGAHLLFKARTDLGSITLSNTPNFAGLAGLDLRVAGGYIVVSPSVHRTGGVYQWQNELPLLPFPDTLIERWIAHRQQAFAPRSGTNTASTSQENNEFTNRYTDHAPRRSEPRYYLHYALSRAIVGQRNRYALYLACRLILDVGLSWQQAAPWMREYANCVPQYDHPYTEEEALSCLDWALRQAA